jgi:hypothetical protein
MIFSMTNSGSSTLSPGVDVLTVAVENEPSVFINKVTQARRDSCKRVLSQLRSFV